MNSIPLYTAFGAGLASFLSPCVLPLVPGYLSFLSGASIDQLRATEGDPAIRGRVMANAGAFVSGILLVGIGVLIATNSLTRLTGSLGFLDKFAL